MKNMNFYTMIIVNHRNKKYTKYISIYIKVKTVNLKVRLELYEILYIYSYNY